MVFAPGSYHNARWYIRRAGRILDAVRGPGRQRTTASPPAGRVGLGPRALGRQRLRHAFQHSWGNVGRWPAVPASGPESIYARRAATIRSHDQGDKPGHRGQPTDGTTWGNLGTASSSQRDLIAVCVWRAPRRRIFSCLLPPRTIAAPPARWGRSLPSVCRHGAGLSVSGRAGNARATACDASRARPPLRLPLAADFARKLSPPARLPLSAFHRPWRRFSRRLTPPARPLLSARLLPGSGVREAIFGGGFDLHQDVSDRGRKWIGRVLRAQAGAAASRTRSPWTWQSPAPAPARRHCSRLCRSPGRGCARRPWCRCRWEHGGHPRPTAPRMPR